MIPSKSVLPTHVQYIFTCTCTCTHMSSIIHPKAIHSHFSSYDQYGFSEAHATADKESITNPLKIKAKKFDQRAQQALSVSH